MITNHTAYKYETPYKGLFVITQFFINITVNLQCGTTKNRYNIRRINPYKYDTKVEESNLKQLSDDVSIQLSVMYFRINCQSLETRYIIG